mmetsp:Transcript_37098/g.93080  ORF Transcript_37098/g.93080 Transcript_37098/m.93080 type:complete len:259 (-) Transcript_37098:1695-2471(-)
MRFREDDHDLLAVRVEPIQQLIVELPVVGLERREFEEVEAHGHVGVAPATYGKVSKPHQHHQHLEGGHGDEPPPHTAEELARPPPDVALRLLKLKVLGHIGVFLPPQLERQPLAALAVRHIAAAPRHAPGGVAGVLQVRVEPPLPARLLVHLPLPRPTAADVLLLVPQLVCHELEGAHLLASGVPLDAGRLPAGRSPDGMHWLGEAGLLVVDEGERHLTRPGLCGCLGGAPARGAAAVAGAAGAVRVCTCAVVARGLA